MPNGINVVLRAFKGLLAYVCLYELYCISLLFSQSSWKAGKERDVIGSVQKDALKHGGDNTDLHMQQHRNLGKLSSRSQDLGPARGHLEEGFKGETLERKSHWNQPGYKNILIWDHYNAVKDKAIIWANIFDRIISGKCPEEKQCKCAFSIKRSRLSEAHAVIFHLLNFHWDGYKWPQQQGRDPNQIWILLFYETTVNLGHRARNHGEFLPRLNYSALEGKFNWTMTLREDADIEVVHGRTMKLKHPLAEGDLQRDRHQRKQKHFKYENYQDTKKRMAPIAWFVSHCETFSRRERYLSMLNKYITTHVYGSCGPLQCGEVRTITRYHRVEKESCFQMVDRRYKFIVAMENSICKDYATEKIFNALKQNAIPLYMSGQMKTWHVFPPHSVIHVSQFKSPEELSQYLHYLIRNETAYEEYFAWRRYYRVESYNSRPDPCNLCSKLHQYANDENEETSNGTQVVQNLHQWMVEGSQCKVPIKTVLSGISKRDSEILLPFWNSLPHPKDPIVEEWKSRKIVL